MTLARSDSCMLVDQSLCVGCEACTAVCKQIYSLNTGVYRTKIKQLKTGTYYEGVSRGEPRIINHKRSCMHCVEAACVMACPTGAMRKEDGCTVIDKRLCIGCNYCAANCPYEAIQYERNGHVMEKCTLCVPRLQQGLEPFCSAVCPLNAIHFGTREEMMDLAQARVVQLKQQGYAQASVYGENQLEGLKVLTVLDEMPEKYGLAADPQISLGLKIWRVVPYRPIALAAVLGVVGFNFLHTRKFRKNDNEKGNQGGDVDGR